MHLPACALCCFSLSFCLQPFERGHIKKPIILKWGVVTVNHTNNDEAEVNGFNPLRLPCSFLHEKYPGYDEARGKVQVHVYVFTVCVNFQLTYSNNIYNPLGVCNIAPLST